MSVLVVLGLIWAAVLIPPALRARAERRAEFIDSFRHQMGTLGGKAQPDRPLPAEPDSDARRRRAASSVKRRRDILGGLLGAMLGSLLLGALPSLRMVWVLHLFLLNTFLGYLALLARQRSLTLRRQGRVAAPAGRAAEALPFRRRRNTPEPALSSALNTSLTRRR